MTVLYSIFFHFLLISSTLFFSQYLLFPSSEMNTIRASFARLCWLFYRKKLPGESFATDNVLQSFKPLYIMERINSIILILIPHRRKREEIIKTTGQCALTSHLMRCFKDKRILQDQATNITQEGVNSELDYPGSTFLPLIIKIRSWKP